MPALSHHRRRSFLKREETTEPAGLDFRTGTGVSARRGLLGIDDVGAGEHECHQRFRHL